MSWKKAAIAAVFALLALSAAAVLNGGDDSEAATGEDLRIYIEDSTGGRQFTTVSASSVEQAVTSAAEKLGISLVFSDLGQIESVDGLPAGGEYTWVIHQWMPLGTPGWASVGFDSESDSKLISGAAYCLHRATTSLEEGKIVYSVPDFEPVSEGYVFVRFVYGYDSDIDEVKPAFTAEIRKSGFWLKGSGSNLGEVLQKAMEDNDFDLSTHTGIDSNGNDLRYWITSMFGMGDRSLGGSNDWAYWSQYVYVNNEWSYNEYTMGYYDPGVYRYLACIYIQSYDGELDTGGTMPDPDKGITVMKRYLDVTFEAEGETVGTAKVEYGKAVASDQMPVYAPPEGYVLRGWGDVTSPVTEDRTFTAVIGKAELYTVVYNWNGGTDRETVTEGNRAAKYSMDVPKYVQDGKEYTFEGWTLDPSAEDPVLVDFSSAVTGNMAVYAVYSSKDLPKYTVTFTLDGAVYGTATVVFGGTLSASDIPDPSDGETGFTGWSNSSVAVTDPIIGDTEFTGNRIFTVRYSDLGTEVHSENVVFGNLAAYRETPVRPDSEYSTYTFIGWSPSGKSTDLFDPAKDPVKENLTLVSVYEEHAIVCTVKFVLDGIVWKTVGVNKGGTLSASDANVTVPGGKRFTGWSNSSVAVTDPITADTEFTGSLVDIVNIVVEYYSSGTLVYTEEVESGGFAVYGGEPTKGETDDATYTFVGWSETKGSAELFDRTASPITEKTALYAVFKENPKPKCTVTFVLGEEVCATVQVVKGTALKEADIPVPSADGMQFSGWDGGSVKLSDKISEDTSFSGKLIPIYTVEYTYPDGGIYRERVVSGSFAAYGGVPSKADTDRARYSFLGWSETEGGEVIDLSSVPVTRSMVLYAVFEEEPFPVCIVRFVINGTEVSSKEVVSGRSLAGSDIPSAGEGYGPVLWDGNVYASITEDTVFTGTSEIIRNTLRFYSEDGILLYTETVAYGGASSYAVQAEKANTQMYTFSFLGWTSDPSQKCVSDDAGSVSLADLKNVVSGMDLRPVFLRSVNYYKVFFYDYDRTFIYEAEAAYGSPVTDYPDDPFREQSVDKVYSFRGWSISTAGWKEADLSRVVQTQYVYANYSYTLRQYDINLYEGDTCIGTYSAEYGTCLNESLFIDSCEGYFSALYSDRALASPIDTTYTVLGDTSLYVKKIPGTYAYCNSGTKVDKSRISVSFTEEQARELKSSGVTVVADLSCLPDGKTAVIDAASLRNLTAAFGDGAAVSVALHRGTVCADAKGLLDAVGDGYAEFSIGKGPGTGKLSGSLRNINYDILYRISVAAGGSVYGGNLTVSVPYVPDANSLNSAAVWSADYGTGVLTEIPCTYSDGYLSFEAGGGTLYAVGTHYARSSVSDDSDPCPYGKVEYTCDGADSATYASTLIRMDLDGGNGTLFVPSALEGYPLKHISDTAFLGVTNVGILVIPSTVQTFDWTSLRSSSVREAYFMGDAPEFTGEAPDHLSVYSLGGTSGWEAYDYGVLALRTYTLGNGAQFTYYLIDGEITVHGYVSGKEFKIPSEISVGGNNCPVTVIGANAFQDSDVTSVRFPSSIREIQTRAFYGSSLRTIEWSSGMELRSICDEAFRSCTDLRTSEIPDGVRFIGFEAYRSCDYLVTISIPDSVEVLGGGAYYVCARMENLTIGSGITEIPERAFAYCTLLDNVYIPGTVTAISENAFYKCYMLTAIDTNNAVTVGSGAFSLCSSLRTVTLGKSLESLGSGVFSGSSMLTQVDAYCAQPEGFTDAWGNGKIPDGVTVSVNYDVADGWTAEHTVIEKEDDLTESFESRTMPYVIGGLIAAFAVLIAYCFRYRPFGV